MKLFFLCVFAISCVSHKAWAQLENTLWLSHHPLGNNVVTHVLYPINPIQSRQVTAAFLVFPAFNNMGSLNLGAQFPLSKVSHSGIYASLLSIGPYQERSVSASLTQSFGEKVSAYVRPGFRQRQVQAYPAVGGFLFQSGVKWQAQPFCLALVYDALVMHQQTQTLLLASVQRELREGLVLGFHARQFPEMPWYFTVDASLQLDDHQLLQLGSGGKHFFFLRYERRRKHVTLSLSFSYGAYTGLAPENAWMYAW